MRQNIKLLKKQIIYRCTHTGIKETDLIYKKTIIKNINRLSLSELQNLSDLFQEISDPEIFLILTGQLIPNKKHESLFDKLIND